MALSGISNLRLYAMKPSVITLVGGAVCLPLTFDLTRGAESLAPSIAIIVVLPLIATTLAIWHGARNGSGTSWWSLALAFSIGAFVSESAFFVHYYYDYGHADQKLGVGIVVALMEVGSIAALGTFSTALTWLTVRRITNHST